jgi:hypothetical protein
MLDSFGVVGKSVAPPSFAFQARNVTYLNVVGKRLTRFDTNKEHEIKTDYNFKFSHTDSV